MASEMRSSRAANAILEPARKRQQQQAATPCTPRGVTCWAKKLQQLKLLQRGGSGSSRAGGRNGSRAGTGMGHRLVTGAANAIYKQ